jgi:death-on-curing family protein
MFEKILSWIKNNNPSLEAEIIDEVKYPTINSIIRFHDFLIEEFKLKQDPVHRGIISKSVLDFTGVKFYLRKKDNKQEDIILRGAHIFNKFLQEGHPFVDGNKRTGFVTLWMFLIINGINFSLIGDYMKEAKRIEGWAENIEKDNIEEILIWIKKNSKILF